MSTFYDPTRPPKLIVGGRETVVLKPTTFDPSVRSAIAVMMPAAKWNKTSRAWEAPNTAATRARLGKLVDVIGNSSVRYVTDTQPRPLPRWSEATSIESSDTPLPREHLAPSPPWHHQRAAYWFLHWARLNLGAALLDCGMRTGKTRMVLEHIASLDHRARRALVVTPTSVVDVWGEQAERHVRRGELNVVALASGSVTDRVNRAVELLTGRDPTVVVVGWSVVQRATPKQRVALRKALSGITVVADEVHYAKAPGSAQSKNLAFISSNAAFRIGASGTPLAHSPLDAYGVFRFLDVGAFGTSFFRFRDRYAVMATKPMGYPQVVGYRNLDELANWMSPYTYRATRDVLQLPPAMHVDVPVTLPPSARKIYDELRDEAVADIESGVIIASNALSRLLRLAQVASGHLPRQDGRDGAEIIHDAKTAALTELFTSSAPEEPWVVFSRFHHDLDQTQRAALLVGRPCMELSGRSRELEMWREACRDGVGPVLAAQIQSGGIGISLVEARYIAYMSVGYSLAEYEQSLARSHGPEQTRPVSYNHIFARGTVDVDIRRAIEKRRDILQYVYDQMRGVKE